MLGEVSQRSVVLVLEKAECWMEYVPRKGLRNMYQ